MFGLGGGRGAGYEGKKILVHLKWASHFGLSIQNFIFPERKSCLVLGGWVGGWLVWPVGVGPPDQHIPGAYV